MKRKKIKILLDYIFIYLGTLVSSVAINAFLVPSKLASGGVTGTSIIINYFTGIPMSVLMLLVNIPLILIGTKQFGKEYGFKTLIGILLLTLNLELTIRLFPDIVGILDYTAPTNMILAALYGGIVMGAGLGIVIKNGGTTGGSDILAGLLNKYFKIPFGESLIVVDSLVILVGGFTFGAEKALYALINLYVTGIVINKIIIGLGSAKMAYIVTSEVEKVKKIITQDLGKTGNHNVVKALYTGKDRDVVTTVLRNREIHFLKELIMEVDKEAFVVVSDVHEVMGRGYTFDQNVK